MCYVKDLFCGESFVGREKLLFGFTLVQMHAKNVAAQRLFMYYNRVRSFVRVLIAMFIMNLN
jgi:hypothetical protein